MYMEGQGTFEPYVDAAIRFHASRKPPSVPGSATPSGPRFHDLRYPLPPLKVPPRYPPPGQKTYTPPVLKICGLKQSIFLWRIPFYKDPFVDVWSSLAGGLLRCQTKWWHASLSRYFAARCHYHLWVAFPMLRCRSCSPLHHASYHSLPSTPLV